MNTFIAPFTIIINRKIYIPNHLFSLKYFDVFLKINVKRNLKTDLI